jgi:hypothetical protein
MRIRGSLAVEVTNCAWGRNVMMRALCEVSVCGALAVEVASCVCVWVRVHGSGACNVVAVECLCVVRRFRW